MPGPCCKIYSCSSWRGYQSKSAEITRRFWLDTRSGHFMKRGKWSPLWIISFKKPENHLLLRSLSRWCLNKQVVMHGRGRRCRLGPSIKYVHKMSGFMITSPPCRQKVQHYTFPATSLAYHYALSVAHPLTDTSWFKLPARWSFSPPEINS